MASTTTKVGEATAKTISSQTGKSNFLTSLPSLPSVPSVPSLPTRENLRSLSVSNMTIPSTDEMVTWATAAARGLPLVDWHRAFRAHEGTARTTDVWGHPTVGAGVALAWGELAEALGLV